MNQIQLFNDSNLLTKQAIKTKVKEIEDLVIDGFLSSLEAKVFAKSLEETYKAINDSDVIKQASIKEVESYGRQDCTVKGANLSLKESVTYDYSNSEAWVSIQNEIEKLRAMQKDIEALAKNTKTAIEAPDQNGELLKVYPAIKKSSTTIQVSLSK